MRFAMTWSYAEHQAAHFAAVQGLAGVFIEGRGAADHHKRDPGDGGEVGCAGNDIGHSCSHAGHHRGVHLPYTLIHITHC